MNAFFLKQFSQNKNDEVSLIWSDGHESKIAIHTLRDRCPCAGCSGESVLFRTYVPPEPQRSTPGRYHLKNAEVVGEYGIKITWGDGHDTGIYISEHLRSLCECEECVAGRISGKIENA